MPLEREKLEEKEVMQGNIYKFFFLNNLLGDSWQVKAIKINKDEHKLMVTIHTPLLELCIVLNG